MGKNKKTTFKTYAAWDFDKEAEEYNRMSAKGWQLVVGGCFHQKYEFDDSVVYRYQLDFNNKIPDMSYYDETFRDAGWERINSTFNGWHIFRKVYDPSLPDEEYQIYTDEQSRIEMLKRWKKIAILLSICTFLTAINPLTSIFEGRYNIISATALLLMYVCLAFMEISAFVGINNLINGRENKHRFSFTLFLTIIFTLLAVFLVSSFIGTGEIWFAIGALTGLVLIEVLVVIASLVSDKAKK